MGALIAERLPSSLASAVELFAHARRGLADVRTMPRIERHVSGARVDGGWLRRYMACTGVRGPGAPGLPPLALQIAAAPLHMAIMADPAFPFRPLGIVHQAQRIEQWRALDPSAQVDLLACTTDACEERRGISFGLVSEALQGGALVWRSEVRVLSITRKGSEVGHRASGDAEFDGLQQIGTDIVEVPESMGRTYARIAGDFNPIHVHALLARPFGFRRAIVHGTWALARALAGAGLPDASAYVLEARFRRPVELPSRILVTDYRGRIPGERWLRVSDPAGERTLLSARLGSPGA
jgi:hypothetical protein